MVWDRDVLSQLQLLQIVNYREISHAVRLFLLLGREAGETGPD